jgi:hydrogenase nickel incorporation protein HypA/HybF
MHELSIAMSLIDVATEEAKRRGVRVVAIHLRLGALSGVVKNALIGSFEMAREATPLAESQLVIEDVPLAMWCGGCQCRREIESVQNLCCPICGEAAMDIVSGRELEVTALEVVDDPADASGRSPAEGAEAK